MSFVNDEKRITIARDLLAAMLQGACSAHVNPMYLSAVIDGVMNSPAVAVKLTDKLIAELESEGEKP
jgi:hypothetical protein